jgi:hypothetical protein
MPILVDGNNLLHRRRSGDRSRDAVRREVLDRTRHERQRVTVVFDGPPPAGAPEREVLGPVVVLYSGGRPADDIIVGLIPGGAAARQWVVVTDDRGLRRRAADAGAGVRSIAEWSRQRPRRPAPRPTSEPRLSSREIDEWAEWFERGPGEE